MISRHTSVRALVPYKEPPSGVAFAIKALLRRLFAAIDRHFFARKRFYFLLAVPALWGLLFGGFSNSACFSSFFRLFFAFHSVAVFLFGFSVFGIVFIPFSVLWVFAVIGSYIKFVSLFAEIHSLLLFLFAFAYLFLAAEGIDAWNRGRLGWRRMFFPDFFTYFAAMLLSVLFAV